MARGKKTGGRIKGTPNAERKELVELLHSKYPGYDPVLAMAEIAHDKKNNSDLIFAAHKEVAKYTRPQLKAIEHSGGVTTTTIEVIEKDGDNPDNG